MNSKHRWPMHSRLSLIVNFSWEIQKRSLHNYNRARKQSIPQSWRESRSFRSFRRPTSCTTSSSIENTKSARLSSKKKQSLPRCSRKPTSKTKSSRQ